MPDPRSVFIYGHGILTDLHRPARFVGAYGREGKMGINRLMIFPRATLAHFLAHATARGNTLDRLMRHSTGQSVPFEPLLNPGIGRLTAQFFLTTVETINYFGGLKKLFKVHFRNVSAPLPHFTETLPDDGYYDMYKVMKALVDGDFNGIVIPDHIPGAGAPTGGTQSATAGRNPAEFRPSPGLGYLIGYMSALLSRAKAEAEKIWISRSLENGLHANCRGIAQWWSIRSYEIKGHWPELRACRGILACLTGRRWMR